MPRARPLAASAAAVLLLALLTGCGVLSSPYENHPREGGQSTAELSAALEAVPGILDAEASAIAWKNPGEGGLFSSSGMDLMLRIMIDPGYHIADSTAFLRSAAHAAWSINDGYSPHGNVILVVRNGLDVDHDWDVDGAAVFGESTRVLRDPEIVSLHYEIQDAYALGADDVQLAVWSEDYERALGQWPADPEPFDPALLAEGTPEGIDPVAVGDYYTSIAAGYRGTDDDPGRPFCVTLSFTRNLNDAGERYAGDVTVTLLARGREVATTIAPGAEATAEEPRYRAEFCDPNRLLSSDYDTTRFHVVAPAAPGFRAVDLGDVSRSE